MPPWSARGCCRGDEGSCRPPGSRSPVTIWAAMRVGSDERTREAVGRDDGEEGRSQRDQGMGPEAGRLAVHLPLEADRRRPAAAPPACAAAAPTGCPTPEAGSRRPSWPVPIGGAPSTGGNSSRAISRPCRACSMAHQAETARAALRRPAAGPARSATKPSSRSSVSGLTSRPPSGRCRSASTARGAGHGDDQRQRRPAGARPARRRCAPQRASEQRPARTPQHGGDRTHPAPACANRRAVPRTPGPPAAPRRTTSRNGSSGAPSRTRIGVADVRRSECVRRHGGDACQQRGEGADGGHGRKQDDREAGEPRAARREPPRVRRGGTRSSAACAVAEARHSSANSGQGQHRQADHVPAGRRQR